MTERFDEGVKEIVLVLLNLGASVYEADYLLKLLKDRPEPIEQKIEGLRQAEDRIDSTKFDTAASQVKRKLTQQAPVLVKLPHLRQPDNRTYIDIAETLIIPSEIHGTDIDSPENKRLHSPYLDDAGLWTIGIGHLIGDGSEASKDKWVAKHGEQLNKKQIQTLFKQDVTKHAKKVESIIGPEVFKKLSLKRQAVLVDIAYRGDLKSKYQFVNLIKQGKFQEAATAYLDHEEYKTRNTKSKDDGVVKRMDRNANIIRGLI